VTYEPTGDELEYLAEHNAEAMQDDAGYMAGVLTRDVNRATTTEALRHIWREARDLPEIERETVRTYTVIKDQMIKEAL
jgi:hypothetical protein